MTVDDIPTESATTPSRRAGWTSRTSTTCAAATGRGRAGRSRPGSTSSTSTRPRPDHDRPVPLASRSTRRTDGYGGDADRARARLLREVLEDTLDEVDGTAAVACRIMRRRALRRRRLRPRARSRPCSVLVGELPDLWDFVVGAWEDDSVTSRFGEEGGAGGLRARPQAADDEAGRRRRPLHVARHDGADGARRRARPHRRGPPVDRRPVPAA